MKSYALPSFWDAYNVLGEDVRQSARKAYRIWSENPDHPSLHFKCVNPKEGIWSIRITLSHRALAIRDGEMVT